MVKRLAWDPDVDYRARATLGVAVAALLLLLPFAFSSLWTGQVASAVGTFGIVLVLAANAISVLQRQNHEVLTLFGLVPAGMVFITQVFENAGIIGALWCYPAILACYCMLSERRAWAANAMIFGIAAPMAAMVLEPHLAARVAATLLAVSVFAVIVVRVINEQQDRLQRQLREDPLTGLLNRYALRHTLESAIDAERGSATVVGSVITADAVAGTGAGSDAEPVGRSLLALDLDHFKAVNDTFGHEAGDQALCGVGTILKSRSPVGSSAFRLGGEEFLVLLPACSDARAVQIADRLRQDIADMQQVPGVAITVSIGVAALQPDDDWTRWMRRSDELLYRAKHDGRNRVMSDTGLASGPAELPMITEPATPATPWGQTAVS